MEKKELEIGDVVQLNPSHDKFPLMFVVVTEPKGWGCQGYLLSPRNFMAVRVNKTELAYVRPTFDQFEYVGHCMWLEED